uniref:Uncharacterized protein n=1 Tax=Marmota marmota marmota TaxID=9994 RepID=A0A8C5ZUL7_MARMA
GHRMPDPHPGAHSPPAELPMASWKHDHLSDLISEPCEDFLTDDVKFRLPSQLRDILQRTVLSSPLGPHLPSRAPPPPPEPRSTEPWRPLHGQKKKWKLTNLHLG